MRPKIKDDLLFFGFEVTIVERDAILGGQSRSLKKRSSPLLFLEDIHRSLQEPALHLPKNTNSDGNGEEQHDPI